MFSQVVPTCGKLVIEEDECGREDDYQRSGKVTVYRQQTIVLPKQMEHPTVACPCQLLGKVLHATGLHIRLESSHELSGKPRSVGISSNRGLPLQDFAEPDEHGRFCD